MHTQSKFRLLVVRLGAMGDILHALPAVTALRLAHPSWHIGWVVEPAWTALLSAGGTGRGPAQPIVDQLHFARTRLWKQGPLSRETRRDVSALRRELRAAEYDVVVDFQGAVRSAIIGKFSRAHRRIGEENPRERAARWLFTERVATHGAHIIEQDVEMAAAIAGDELEPVQPKLPVDPAAEAWCSALLTESDTRPVALINPGAGWGAKRWPIERYAAVAAQLVEKGFRVIVNAGPKELALAEEMHALSGGSTETQACSITELIALTRRVAVVIAGDTGPLHLACALKKPVVGIYGPTDPARNGPYGTRFKVLRSPESVRDHTRRAEPEAGLLTIEPAHVLQAVDEVLSLEKAG